MTKACRPDLISPRIVKECATTLYIVKTYIYYIERLITSRLLSSNWKDATVTAIYKKADKYIPPNYNPISQAMERRIHKHLYNCISENNLLTHFHSGFIQGVSITFQLLHTNHSFLEAVDSGKEERVAFCDISKAFDRVWHRGLLHK